MAAGPRATRSRGTRASGPPSAGPRGSRTVEHLVGCRGPAGARCTPPAPTPSCQGLGGQGAALVERVARIAGVGVGSPSEATDSSNSATDLVFAPFALSLAADFLEASFVFVDSAFVFGAAFFDVTFLLDSAFFCAAFFAGFAVADFVEACDVLGADGPDADGWLGTSVRVARR